ncbi:MAG: hypothetical protein QFF03_02375 [Pseudomonadota bacterium]|nr:hypothetical protein [Pseudomonadota bacterium]
MAKRQVIGKKQALSVRAAVCNQIIDCANISGNNWRAIFMNDTANSAHYFILLALFPGLLFDCANIVQRAIHGKTLPEIHRWGRSIKYLKSVIASECRQH